METLSPLTPISTFTNSSPIYTLEINSYLSNLKAYYPSVAFPPFKPRRNATKSLDGYFTEYKKQCQDMINNSFKLGNIIQYTPTKQDVISTTPTKQVRFTDIEKMSDVLPRPASPISPEKTQEQFAIQIPIQSEVSEKIKAIFDCCNIYNDNFKKLTEQMTLVGQDLNALNDSVCNLEREQTQDRINNEEALKCFKTLTAGHMTVQSEFEQRIKAIEQRIKAIEDRIVILDKPEEDTKDSDAPQPAGYFESIELSILDLLGGDFSKLSTLCKKKLILDLEDIISELKIEN